MLADYNLSRTTDVYIEGDCAMHCGGLVGAQLKGFVGFERGGEDHAGA
ncbi:hypothetical protein PWR63_29500 [Paraburkholderia sp. A2WS-5]